MDTAQPPTPITEPQTPTAPGGQVKASYYGRAIKGSWAAKIQDALMDPALLDLTQDVALLRSLIANFVQGLGDRLPTADELDTVIKGVEAVGRATERIAGKQGTLTAKGAAYLIEVIMRIIMEEVGQHDPKSALRVADRLKNLGPDSMPRGMQYLKSAHKGA